MDDSEGRLRDGFVYLGTAAQPDGSGVPQYLDLSRANRHGLITGATGTGKTVSLQILAEGFSEAGIPVFCADVKGDLAGLAFPGEEKDFLAKRAETIGFSDYFHDGFPVTFWDLNGRLGHPLRATISEMGPLLLSDLMELNDVQEGVLNIAFKIADEEGLLLLDLIDLQALLAHLAEHADEVTNLYGNVSKASVGAIQRRLLVLENQGAEQFFGEPALKIDDLMRTARDGRGMINVLAAEDLMRSPRLYATFLLWLLAELFEELPEVGDPDKPVLAFFFDEAHLLFDDAPKGLTDKIEQVVKLIRSKGVGVYFVTQNPLDVPDAVLAQLGNRIQHALRAYTPRERRAVKAAAETFRTNPDLDTEEVIGQLGVGEALVSTLVSKGEPSMVQRTLIRPPSSRMGTITPEERADILARSPMGGEYDTELDRESAHEILAERAAEAAKEKEEVLTREADKARRPKEAASSGGLLGTLGDLFRGNGRRQSVGEAVVKSAARTATTLIVREIVRGTFGSMGRSKTRKR